MPWLIAIALWSLLGCSPPHEIVALDGESGAIRWRNGEAGRVVGRKENRIVVEREREIVGLDAGSGIEVWRVDRPQGFRVVESLRPNLPLFLLEADGAVTELDPASGKPSGSAQPLSMPAGEVRRVSSVVSGVAFVQTHDGRWLRCRADSSTPESLAQTHAAIAPVDSPRGPVAVLADASLAAFDYRTGAERWRIAGLPAAHSLAYRYDALWLGGSNGALLSIDDRSGQIRLALPDAGTDARLVSEGSIPFAPTLVRDGRGVAILDPESGAVTRSIAVTERISSAAVISRSILVRRAEDGIVLGFDRDTGDRRFTAEVGPVRTTSVVVLDPRAPEASLLD